MPFTVWKRPSSRNSQDNNEESIETNDTELEIMGPSNAEDYSWIMGGCFTSWDRQNGRLVLLFFGDQSILEVEKRLQNFLSSPENANAAIRDPYVLHAVILDELFFTMDSTVWELLKVFRGIEKVCASWKHSNMYLRLMCINRIPTKMRANSMKRLSR